MASSTTPSFATYYLHFGKAPVPLLCAKHANPVRVRYINYINSSMASSSGPTVSEYEVLVESLREISRKDAQLVDDRAKLLDVLTKLTDRNEQLLREEQKTKDTYEGELNIQRGLVAALDKQNGLLREMVEEQEDEITELEHKISTMETATSEGRPRRRRDVPTGDLDKGKKARAKLSEQDKVEIDKNLLEKAREGELEDAEVLIVQGADVDARGYYQFTPLMHSSFHGHLDMVEALLTHRASIEARSDEGFTSLMMASENGHLDIVVVLVARGAQINARNNNNDTPLILASSRNHLEVVTALIAAGASVNLKGTYGRTALHWATTRHYSDVAQALRDAGAQP